MKVADTFQTYHSFSETFELDKQGQNALYRVYASETVQNYLKKHPGRQRHRNPRHWCISTHSSITLDLGLDLGQNHFAMIVLQVCNLPMPDMIYSVTASVHGVNKLLPGLSVSAI